MEGKSTSKRQFQMGERLGKGGFGVVYRATMQSPGGLRSDVAIKLLHNPTEDSLRRLRKEAKLLAALSHPAILRVHDLCKLQGRIALVTEYVGGMDLADAFRYDTPLSPRALVQVIGVVAEAIHAAWNTVPPGGDAPLRLVHRDIKPANIRIGAHGEVKLLDFGIAFAEEADQAATGETRGTSFIGSVPYMAPERFGRTQAVPEGDVYALGCTLYEGLAGERLHADVTLGQMAQRCGVESLHDSHVLESLDKLSEVSQPLLDLVRDCCAHDASKRPAPGDVFRRCEGLVDEMRGMRLKAWCRALPAGATVDSGPLSGRVLSEGTLALGLTTGEAGMARAVGGIEPTETYFGEEVGEGTWSPGDLADLADEPQGPATAETVAPPDPVIAPEPEIAEPSRSTGPPYVWIGLAAMLALGMVGVGSWAALGGIPSGATSEDPAASVDPEAPSDDAPVASSAPESTEEDPTDAVVDGGSVEEPAAVAVEPLPATPKPAPVRAQPREAPAVSRSPPTRVKPAPSPDPAEADQAAPEPEPEVVAPEPPAMGSFSVEGEVTRVRLANASGKRFAPGALPAGAYTVYAAFAGDELTNTQVRLTVPADGRLTVRCNPLQWTCDRVR